MTEMSPSRTMARTEGIGAAMPLVELRLVSEAGEELPWDGKATGELYARGPHVAAGYYNHPAVPGRLAAHGRPRAARHRGHRPPRRPRERPRQIRGRVDQFRPAPARSRPTPTSARRP